ncbi:MULTISPECIES: 5'/3'-nucleotidase SurE [Pantoea]|uniref:5'/3'-nucleotidase SurE n=1 Tax=Pantoea TaxID=53335 RepID=UPI0010449B52|nr:MULTISPECIES: 5'/3'-nucleotidase SurE [Pantoea]MDQ0435559.1 5'-nucleotidase [Pantoea agglomerans]NEG88345.1 5'/3'-nucleotidase SurE [Pantoea agglomerans]NEH10365.1 5'/3'-nucleotidase SurE [Pantoea agglomerans]TCZ24903.1 5'/3'-nucleotidase SurE [Pantoea agglomerans]TSH79243.1 5'/3'-nucleotidase SurE [Pantoea sp. paga]
MDEIPLMYDRILLTNDDGINAPGMAVLRRVAEQLAHEVWIVAPAYDQSGTSHSLSLHEPLRVHQTETRCYAISGTPGDCVVWATRYLMSNNPPDLLLSGINRGANIGAESVLSGTVGAAMTGMLLNIPSIALSQVFSKRDEIKWDTAEVAALKALRQVLRKPWAGSCLNINIPDVPPEKLGEIVFTEQGKGNLEDIRITSHTDPRAECYFWISLSRSILTSDSGSEAAAIINGNITITPLQFERTQKNVLRKLRN